SVGGRSVSEGVSSATEPGAHALASDRSGSGALGELRPAFHVAAEALVERLELARKGVQHDVVAAAGRELALDLRLARFGRCNARLDLVQLAALFERELASGGGRRLGRNRLRPCLSLGRLGRRRLGPLALSRLV